MISARHARRFLIKEEKTMTIVQILYDWYVLAKYAITPKCSAAQQLCHIVGAESC